MDHDSTPESGVTEAADALTLDDLTALAEHAAGHPAVAPPLRTLVPALVALVREQADFIASFKA